MMNFFGSDPNVQRVIHYHRMRPLHVLVLGGMGYLVGWLASCDVGRQAAIQAACGPIRLSKSLPASVAQYPDTSR